MNAILKHRIDNGLTCSALAERLDVDPATVWRWETEKTRIPADRLIEIERVTGIPRRELRPDLFETAA